MPDPKQTLESDPSSNNGGGQNAESGAAPSSVGTSADANQQAEAIALERINAITHRQFATLEDAQKHYEGLNKLVGDNAIADYRKKAEFSDRVLASVMREQKLGSVEEARTYLENLMPEETIVPTSESKPKVDPNIEARLRAGERAEFLLENPEAKTYLPKVEEYAKATGKPLKESFEFLFGDLVKDQKAKADKVKADEEAKRKEKREAQAIGSSTSTAPPKVDPTQDKLKEYAAGKAPKGAMSDIIKERWERKMNPSQNEE